METFCTNVDDAPSLPGAYILVIKIINMMTVTLPGKQTVSLVPGRYLYCGSAKGPGGPVRFRTRRISWSARRTSAML